MKDGNTRQMGAGYVQHVDDSSSLGLSVKVTREANFGPGYIFRPMCGEGSVKGTSSAETHPLTLSPYLKPFLRWVGVINPVMASVPYYSNLNADRLAKRGDRRLHSAPPSLAYRLTPWYALLCRTAQPDDVVNGGDSKSRPKRAALVPFPARFDHRLERADSCMH
ncbi:uncharacterized protein B0T23DRAFT_405334 [Neurospora hispaniola]|uniref:Uncharacterized protein n=1 Tax=Neurospora hispaniola TaxID=588809 RepID=A0AAJ0I578_9PEZI|nr:hypothetical protein B0T23DRAFT_405334 [Neurospora hispaniola]